MSFKDKSPAMQRLQESLMGTATAHQNSQCVPVPVGCGRTISQQDFNTWSETERSEYAISGWCNKCQVEAFRPLDEEPDDSPDVEITNEAFEEGRDIWEGMDVK